MPICTFCGHSTAPESIRPRLAAEIRRHITELGVTEFWVGSYGAFDRMARGEVEKAKAQFPAIRLCLLVPYLPEKRLDSQGVDQVLYPEELETVPKRLAIPRLNRYMVEQAQYLIAYVAHVSGGAYKTLDAARTREKMNKLQIVNLGEP